MPLLPLLPRFRGGCRCRSTVLGRERAFSLPRMTIHVNRSGYTPLTRILPIVCDINHKGHSNEPHPSLGLRQTGGTNRSRRGRDSPSLRPSATSACRAWCSGLAGQLRLFQRTESLPEMGGPLDRIGVGVEQRRQATAGDPGAKVFRDVEIQPPLLTPDHLNFTVEALELFY